MSRETFESVLQRLRQKEEDQRAFRKSMREVYNMKAENRVRQAYFEKYPRRRKFNMDKAVKDLGEETVDRLFGPLIEDIDRQKQEFKETIEALKAELTELAESVGISASEEPLLFASCSRSAYSTQTDSDGYAEGRAVLDALPLAKAGIAFETRKTEHSYEIWANLDDVSAEALKLQPITFDDIAEESHRLGRNPLVYFPLCRDLYDTWMQKYRDKARGARLTR